MVSSVLLGAGRLPPADTASATVSWMAIFSCSFMRRSICTTERATCARIPTDLTDRWVDIGGKDPDLEPIHVVAEVREALVVGEG